VHELPAPRPRRAVPLRSATWLLLLHHQQVLLERRPGAGLWGGLWTFPVASNASYAAQARELGCEISSARELEPLEHGFTHFRLRIRPVLCGVARTLPRAAAPGRLWIDLEDAAQAAAPAPVKKLIARLGASNASW
jgi:A/G-specific adenine glycosylase